MEKNRNYFIFESTFVFFHQSNMQHLQNCSCIKEPIKVDYTINVSVTFGDIPNQPKTNPKKMLFLLDPSKRLRKDDIE
jgi:hypothetical protein